ncbi:MAG: hypothetical protein BGO49_22715 [Planctomycetales bacterium 71-10]|nr:MAG: hypothetical protein BGO49_22715 [Planctomycetales bacterium 71-10]
MERNRRIAPQGSQSDALASRLAAQEALAAAMDLGPALLTGEPGAGKTWLRRRLVESLAPAWGAAVVEAAPAIDAVDFLTLAAAKLGVAPLPDRPATLRLAIEKALEDDALEGRRRLLVVEDAHHASPEVWAEVEALCDRLGEPGGFAAALVVGRTELTRRMASQPLRPLATRLSRHVHLPPLDMAEAAGLLPGVAPGELEILHRDAAGNPRRLLALAGDRAPRPAVPAPSPVAEAPPPLPSFPSRTAEPKPSAPLVVPHPGAPKVEIPVEPRQSPPALLPSRPPLRVEDGLIEVGWAGSLEAEEADDLDETEDYAPADGELIDDHYAALQAWSEWARNRDRLSRPAEEEPAEDDAEEIESDDEPEEIEPEARVAEEEAEADVESPLNEDLRAEPAHDHAPFSQLFGKMRMSS